MSYYGLVGGVYDHNFDSADSRRLREEKIAIFRRYFAVSQRNIPSDRFDLNFFRQRFRF